LLTLIPSLLPIPSYLFSSTAQAQTSQDWTIEADKLLEQGIQQFDISEYQAAIRSWQQTLAIYQQLKDRDGEASSLNNLGLAYYSLGQYPKAIEFHQQSLAIKQEIGDRNGEATSLNNLGGAYFQLGQYPKAIEFYQQSLAIFREISNRNGEGLTLGNLGNVYNNLGEYPKAIEFYQQSLAIQREIGNRNGFASSLMGLGNVYNNLGEYPKAIEFYQQSLAIQREIGNRNGFASSLMGLGNAYNFLGEYPKAIEFYQQSLAIQREIGNRNGFASSLMGLGNAYNFLGEYPKAIEFYQQSLAIQREIGNRNGFASSLMALGSAYGSLGEYPKAIEFYQQSLAIKREIGDRKEVANSLNNLGNAYANLGQYPKAIEFHQQSLGIAREIGNREGESIFLSNIGLTLQKQQQPELAIVFYKQSVNITEGIRQDLRKLPREQQESYTQTVADTYRSLADLLISQGRLLEAQQVLELLKIQELRDFTRNARAGGETAGIALSRIEEDILKKYGTLIAFGLKLYECEQQKCNILSQLRDQLDTLTQQFNQDTNTFRKTLQERLAKDPALMEPEQVRNTAAKIVTAEPDTILVYPLVLKDKIRILLATRAGEKGVVFRTFETPVNQQQLWNKVSQFRTELSNPNGEKELKAISQELYNWLIKPLEGEIKGKNVRNLVFSLDRSTRYIPMAALFDGKQYLIERYGISTILNAGLTDVKDRLPSKKQDIKVLAMGVSKAFPGFNALSNVPLELANIVQKSGKENTGIFPGSEFLDEAFIFPTLRDNLSGNKILHIATHGKFESGRPENSFLLSGTGEELKIDQIQTLQNYMKDTHLVVLSACETALGGVDADGIEMSGISFYFLTNGAKAVIASLWLVNDASTSQLMQQFYQNLSTGKMTKAQALREAQIAMIQDSKIQSGDVNRSSVNYTPGQSRNSESISHNLSHPYYWSPFILIGNGL
jgi:CHAT domain-containing protein/tetratricopeptide (TPR) repeat protein